MPARSAATRVCPPFRASPDALAGRRATRAAERRPLAESLLGLSPQASAAWRGGSSSTCFTSSITATASSSTRCRAERTVVTCHDLDTFRCLLEPSREPRPRWFRAMARRILTGFQKAAVVVCDSEATRQAVLAHDLGPRVSAAHGARGHRTRVAGRARPRGRRRGERGCSARPTRRARPSCCTSARTSPASGSTSCWRPSPPSAGQYRAPA